MSGCHNGNCLGGTCCAPDLRAPLSLYLWIPGTFPGMNEITKAAKSGRGKGNGYSRMKAACDLRVKIAARGAVCIAGKARILFMWHEPTRRRDPDNVSAAQKFILDGLVKAGVMAGDGWGEVKSITHEFRVTPDRPGVEVCLTEVIE